MTVSTHSKIADTDIITDWTAHDQFDGTPLRCDLATLPVFDGTMANLEHTHTDPVPSTKYAINQPGGITMAPTMLPSKHPAHKVSQ